MMSEFDGKVILISGASSGIGKSTLNLFLDEDVTIIAASKNQKRGDEINVRLKSVNKDSIWLPVDILNSQSVEHLFHAIAENFNEIHVAFNNASSGGGSNLLHEFIIDDWQNTIQGTLTSVFQFMKHELRFMTKQKYGAIINNSSVDGLRAFPFDPAYSAAKHGVIGLTKSSALQYAKQGIRINAICPGWIDTPPVRNLIKDGHISEEEILMHQPINRLGRPEEVANAVYWLASEKAKFVTGSIITIDGGYTAF